MDPRRGRCLPPSSAGTMPPLTGLAALYAGLGQGQGWTRAKVTHKVYALECRANGMGYCYVGQVDTSTTSPTLASAATTRATK